MRAKIVQLGKGGHKIKGNPYSILNIALRVDNGETFEAIEKEMIIEGKKKANEDGKVWGECESCEQVTVLVDDVWLCGPCCFGEAETYNGNW